MTKYLSGKPFSVKPGARDPKECAALGHGWTRETRRGVECVQCGEVVEQDTPTKTREIL